MKRVLSGILLLVFLCAGCRRHTSKSEDAGGPVSNASAEKIAVDEGCPHTVEGKCAHPSDAAVDGDGSKASGRFGKPLGKSPEVRLVDILESPEQFHERKVRVSGHVSRACSRKGCWMELAVDNSADALRCRVTFEDYGFFVPKDSAGSQALLEGTVELTLVKPEAVQHYESEGAKFPGKQADGSAREVRLVATGVELERI